MKLKANLSKFKESVFARNIVETFGTRFLLILIGVVSSVLVARVLGPEGRGLFALAGAVGAIGIQFGNLGIQASNTYYVAQNTKLLPQLLANSLLVGLGVGGVGAYLVWGIFQLWPDIAPVQGSLMVLALAWIPLGLVYLFLQNLLIGVGKIRGYNIIELVTKILYTVVIISFVLINMVDVNAIYGVVLATGALGAVWAYYMVIQMADADVRPSFSLFKASFTYGIKAYFVALFSYLVLRIDIFMIQFLLNTEAVGYYSIAVTLADYLYMLPAVVGTVLFPRLSGMKSTEEKWIFTNRLVRGFTPAMLSITLVAGLCARPTVMILFGEAFAPAVAAFLWLLPGIFLLAINTIYMNYFAALGMPMVALYSTIGATMLNIVLNLFLLPKWGMVGASVSSTISYSLMIGVSIAYIVWTQKDTVRQTE